MDAEALDREDELAGFRSEFYLPTGLVYLDGNSLGLLSRPAEQSIMRVIDEWRTMGVGGWTQAESPWFFLAEELSGGAAALVGADADEVIVANSTTVNLHQLLATLMRSKADSRNTILTDCFAFPTDSYAIDSFIQLMNSRSEGPALRRLLIGSDDGYLLDEDTICAAMTEDVRMAVLPSVVYTSGQLLDMQRVACEARKRGILIGFDCSHSVGCIPHRLSEWDVDFAFWCSYKYLNGGPGATGGLYLNRRHHHHGPGLAGWFSSRKESQLDMSPALTPSSSAGALQIGTPGILSMAPLCGSLDLISRAGIGRIRAKSLAQTRYLMELAEDSLTRFGIRVITPAEDCRRGGHVALAHPEAMRICMALRDAGVVPDFRPADIIRLAPSPLYNTFQDCGKAIDELARTMASQSYLNYSLDRPLIT